MQNDFQAIGMKKRITITDTNSRFSACQHWKLVSSDMLFFHGLVAAPVVFSDPWLLTYMVKSMDPPVVVCGLYFCTSWQRGKGNWDQEWQPCSLFCPTGPSSVCQQWGNALEPNLSTQPERENKKPECVRKLALMISSQRPLSKIQNQQDNSEVKPTMHVLKAFSVEQKNTSST